MDRERLLSNAKELTQKLKVQKSSKEGCKILLQYLSDYKDQFFSKELTSGEFEIVRELFDQIYVYAKRVGGFEDLVLSLRLGGNIPPAWLKENPLFKTWIKSNYLHHRFFVLRLVLPFDENLGALIPVEENQETKWVVWKEIYEKIDDQYRFLPEYTVLWLGICSYNGCTDPNWLPFQMLNPLEWGGKHILEVCTVSLPDPNPSMFLRRHAYIVLKDNQGNVRSVGQDVLVDRKNYRMTEILNRKPGFGKITTPDVYVFFPKNSRRFWKSSFEITKEDHDRIIALVEKDKRNKGRSMSLLKGNCVSYVLKILQEGIGVEIDASVHGIHILLKAALPDRWYRAFVDRFNLWYRKQNKFIQKGMFFIPFVYILHLIIGGIAFFTRQNNYQEMKDFSLKDLLIYPWKLAIDHPFALQRRLEEFKK